MLDDIKQNKINLIISYKIDRLTRSPKDFYQLIELFEKNGVDFISVTERFDTSTPSVPIPLIPATHSDSIRPPLCRSEATLVFDILPIH
jgi:DNA invertase Pin-like site-specific DNA recombinase